MHAYAEEIERTPRTDRQLQIVVGNRMLATALTEIARRKGWSTVAGGDSSVLVTDAVAARTGDVAAGGSTVLVCEPTAFDARIAIDAVAELIVVAVVLSDEPDDLALALDAVADDRGTIPGRVLRLAGEMPVLSERQSAVLAAVVHGSTNTEISRDLPMSLATVKREVAVLYQALSAVTRPALIAEASRLGVRPSVGWLSV